MRKFGLITALAAGVALTATSAMAQTTIKYSNDWKWEGPAAPMLMALDKGWYSEAGIGRVHGHGQRLA